MSFTVDWYIVGRVIKVQIAGDVTLSDIEAISQQLIVLLDAGTAPLVHVMGDLAAMQNYPPNLKEMQRVSQPHVSHPRTGWILMYGMTSPLVNFIASTILQLARIRTRMVSSEAEAIAFLREHDESLRELLPQSS
jgi:hypothetical protein